MKIAILGCRGIPNRYGGFEKFAEIISVGLAAKGLEIYVYSSHDHPNKEDIIQNVKIIHKYDPEYKIGTFGQFIYDFNCILDARKRKFDIIYQLGYTSSSIWFWLLPRNSIIISNMDGLEWKRKKYSYLIRKFLKFAERLAIWSSDHLVADSVAIKDYLENFSTPVTFIPYGAASFSTPNAEVVKQYDLKKWEYNLLVARFVPENNIDMILSGVEKSQIKHPFLVIGNHSTKYGKWLKKRFGNSPNIKFVGPIYNDAILNNLRFYSNLYFHGHSVGGTNPSLLEAMASKAVICAHKNVFNREVLDTNALYFCSSEEVRAVLDGFTRKADDPFLDQNLKTIEGIYNWDKITESYHKLFQDLLLEKNELFIQNTTLKVQD